VPVRDIGLTGKVLVVAASRDQERGWVHAFSLVDTSDDGGTTPNPNTSGSSDDDYLAEPCGCSVGLSGSWAFIVMLPFLTRRRKED
jgi:hypothetical protein